MRPLLDNQPDTYVKQFLEEATCIQHLISHCSYLFVFATLLYLFNQNIVIPLSLLLKQILVS